MVAQKAGMVTKPQKRSPSKVVTSGDQFTYYGTCTTVVVSPSNEFLPFFSLVHIIPSFPPLSLLNRVH